MAGKSATRAAKQAEPEEEGRDLTAYAEKPINPKAEAYSEWLEEATGYEVDPRSVMLAVNLHMLFQGSEEWRSDPRNPRSPAGRKARAAANGAEEEPPKRRGRAAKATEEDEDEEAPAARRATRRGTAAAKPAASKAPAAKRGTARPAPASGRRGRSAKTAEDSAAAPY